MIRNAIILLILSTIALNAKDVIKPYKKMYDDGKTIEVEGSKKLIKTTPKSMQDGVVEIECGIQKSYHPNGKIKSEIKYTCYPMESSDSTSNIIYEKKLQ